MNYLSSLHGVLPPARLALFLAAIAPMSVWLFSGAGIVHPWHAVAWALGCAILLAAFPGRGAKLSACLQTAALPWTLGWIGSVAVTGYGPSNAAISAIDTGALHEMGAAVQLAIARPAFLLASLLTVLALAWAWRLNTQGEKESSNAVGIVFLCALMPTAAANMNGTNYQHLAEISIPEVRNTVIWFSHIEIAKEAISRKLDALARGRPQTEAIRSVADASHQFEARAGLAVFVAGESLRADAFLVEGRGPWSKALGERLAKGLGTRLSDACAGGNSTHVSLPMLLTATYPENRAMASGPTILASAKAAGARTAYIMNHETWVVPEVGHDLLQKTSAMERPALDDVVVASLADFIERSGKGPKAAILHLYGQHFAYHDRYPHSVFPEIPKELTGDQLEELHYARAAEYGLKVLLDLATLLDHQDEPAFLVFTSDHGENLPSDKTGKSFHAGPSSGINDTMVPALVLWNKAFAESGRIQQLDPLKTVPLIAHSDLARIWLTLAGLPGDFTPTATPMTWGAVEAGPPGFIDCRRLKL